MPDQVLTEVCPACASGKVVTEEGGLDEPAASCQECGWSGQAKELIAVPLPLSGESLEINQDRALEIAQEMSRRYMELLYRVVAKPIGHCLYETGMVGRKDTEALSRLIRAACLGAFRGTLDEVEKIASERKASRTLS